MLATVIDTRALRRNATRARILEAAWALARHDGLAAISLRKVAETVGMRAPSLYKHFGSKHAIYDAMYAAAATELAETLAGRPRGATPAHTLRNRVRVFMQFCTADPLRYQLLLERPIPNFEPTPESFAITAGALAGTRADLEAAGVHGEQALDLMRALITGLVSLQVANDPGGNRWSRLTDDALSMFLAYHTGQDGGSSVRSQRRRR